MYYVVIVTVLLLTTALLAVSVLWPQPARDPGEMAAISPLCLFPIRMCSGFGLHALSTIELLTCFSDLSLTDEIIERRLWYNKHYDTDNPLLAAVLGRLFFHVSCSVYKLILCYIILLYKHMTILRDERPFAACFGSF